MRYYFHEYAETEFDRAVEYYEDCRHGLGIDFAREVYTTIDRIIQYPEAWSPMSRNTRRCLVNRSPLASFIKSSLTSCASSQLPTFDVAQTTGWTGGEQNKQMGQTAILSRLKRFKIS